MKKLAIVFALTVGILAGSAAVGYLASGLTKETQAGCKKGRC